jgi:uncharacterized membrane protein
MTVLALCLLIGIVAGLRSMTAPAAVSWAAHLDWINLHRSPLEWMGSRVTVALFTLAALAELVADKLPRTPNRTSPGPLIARLVLGGLAAASLAVAGGESLVTGAVLGTVGAGIGAFGGYEIRRRLVTGFGLKDGMVAVIEDLVAIGLAWIVVSQA